jgi:voltage-gated potassium channel Kch
MEIGVDSVIRESFHSSLMLARAVYGGLGISDHKAEQIISHFRDYDEALLGEQYIIHRDEAAMIKSTRDSLEHLMGLFAHDAEESDHMEQSEESKDSGGGHGRDTRRPTAE